MEKSITILVFTLGFFQEKTNDKIFQKIQKKLFGEPFWALFTQISAKMNFPGKKPPAIFKIFQLSTIVPEIRKN